MKNDDAIDGTHKEMGHPRKHPNTAAVSLFLTDTDINIIT